MAGNSIGDFLRLTTWGESHGNEIGGVLEGVPPKILIDEKLIQMDLNRRLPGKSRFVTQRKELDKIKIVSGILNGMTTGTPIGLIIDNIDQKGKDYIEIEKKFRPAHADYTYWKKYGIRDHRGGGRSSARETAIRVAAGSIAKQILGDKISIRGALIQLGEKKINRENWDWKHIDKNPFFCPDPNVIKEWEKYLDSIRKSGLSCGAIIEVVATGVPAGIGEPIYGKLDSDLAKAIMSINAVKGVEIGDGFASAINNGMDNADEMQIGRDGKVEFLSNHAGGILGGISTGQPIVLRFAVKPTSSILKELKTIDQQGNNTTISTKGRHDPCVGIRAVPIGEAMMAIVIADQLLRDRGQVLRKDRRCSD